MLFFICSLSWLHWGREKGFFMTHIPKSGGPLLQVHQKRVQCLTCDWGGGTCQFTNYLPSLFSWFYKVDDLAVGKCIPFPPPLLARSKAAAYHVSSGQCNTTPAKQARHSGVGWHVFEWCERLMLQLRSTMMGGGDWKLQSVCFYPGVWTVSAFLSAGLLSQDTKSKTAIGRDLSCQWTFALNWSFFWCYRIKIWISKRTPCDNI